MKCNPKLYYWSEEDFEGCQYEPMTYFFENEDDQDYLFSVPTAQLGRYLSSITFIDHIKIDD